MNSLALSGVVQTNLLDDLRRDSGVLEGISVDCVKRLEGLRVVSFYERKYTGRGWFSVLVGYFLSSFLLLHLCLVNFADFFWDARWLTKPLLLLVFPMKKLSHSTQTIA